MSDPFYCKCCEDWVDHLPGSSECPNRIKCPLDPVDEVLAEIERATEKFPTWPTDPLHAFAVVGEEHGELQKELLQLTYEPHKSSMADARKEAVQLAAMALRFLMSFDRYEFKPGSQHSQNRGGVSRHDER